MSHRDIPADLRERVRLRAGDRCGYCLSSQRYVLGRLEVEHIIPTAGGGSDRESNLWLACRLCDNAKDVQTLALDPATGRRVKLFNPRRQRWRSHFGWDREGTRILGKTPCGRATVLALQLNNALSVMVRREWVGAGWHPPPESL